MSAMMVVDRPPLETSPRVPFCSAGSPWRVRVYKKILMLQEVVLVVVVPIGTLGAVEMRSPTWNPNSRKSGNLQPPNVAFPTIALYDD